MSPSKFIPCMEMGTHKKERERLKQIQTFSKYLYP